MSETGGGRPAEGQERPAGIESTADLVSKLSEDVARLVRQELELARAELAQSARRSAVGGGMLAGAACCGALCVASLHGGLIRSLTSHMSPIAGGIVAALLYGSAGTALSLAGVDRLRKEALEPTGTLSTLEEGARWVAHPTRSETT